MEGLIIFIISASILAFLLFRKKKTDLSNIMLPENYKEILQKYVAYYKALPVEKKSLFEEEVKLFLSYVRVHGVKNDVTDTDRLLVAASAVIPIFGFPEWHYYNLRDVLLYNDTFNADTFATEGNDRNVLGMVGSGTMSQMMILSKDALYQGFQNTSDKNNTSIHEFVHLIDKADGSADGVPETLMSKQYVIPWLKMIHKDIKEIVQHSSDINPYGATNEAEFFAVASEYFFERPDLFQQKHPELFSAMEKIFRQEPATLLAKA
jgi:MtfA peptidase